MPLNKSWAGKYEINIGWLKLTGRVIAMAWPLLVYYGHDSIGSWPLLFAGIALLAWRMPGTRWLLAFMALLLFAIGVAGHAALGVMAYPVAVNALMLILFLGSLLRGPTIIERLARLREPELSSEGVAYTRRVTQAWCWFFFCNGSISAWTVWKADMALWTAYNGIISYLLMGAMFAGEWLLRRRLTRRTT